MYKTIVMPDSSPWTKGATLTSAETHQTVLPGTRYQVPTLVPHNYNVNRIVVVRYTCYGCYTYRYMDHKAGCLRVTIIKTSIPSFSSSFTLSPLSGLRIPYLNASCHCSTIISYFVLMSRIDGSKKNGSSFLHLHFARDSHWWKSKKPKNNFFIKRSCQF